MKLKGKITMLVGAESTTIRIRDNDASIDFVEIKLTSQQFCAALSRLANTDCEVEVHGFDKVGKTQENKQFQFEIPEGFGRFSRYKDRDIKDLTAYVQELLDKEGEGWIAEGYFGSQNSFFEEEGKRYAQCTIRRWI